MGRSAAQVTSKCGVCCELLEVACSLRSKKNVVRKETGAVEPQSQVQDDGEVVVQLSPAVGED